ncbi:hypothetical protein [Shewanella algae]|uniref:hypothetical protein n=1 Tax=Shewanella algae TaxID=38313 RepID=UPI0031F4F4FE
MTINFYYKDNDLYITKKSFDKLKSDNNPVAFKGIIAAAKETISRDHAFIVYEENDSSIIRKCDRMSELEDEIGQSE